MWPDSGQWDARGSFGGFWKDFPPDQDRQSIRAISSLLPS